jgi:hypothetical protein
MNIWCLIDGDGGLVGVYSTRELAQRDLAGMLGYGWRITERWLITS